MLKKIIKEVFQIREATELKDGSFKYFYIDDIEELGDIHDIEDLMSNDTINVALITDKNFAKDELTNKDTYKISTEELEKYMVKSFDGYGSGDFMDFMGGYGFEDLIGGYLEDVKNFKWYKKYADLEQVMDADKRLNMDDESA